jgi:cytochrome c-type protein NapC
VGAPEGERFSLECRNCHQYRSRWTSPETGAARRPRSIQRYLGTGQATCIDCHKGIAHELPNMDGIEPGWKVPQELQGEQLPEASVFDRLERMGGSPHHTSWMAEIADAD